MGQIKIKKFIHNMANRYTASFDVYREAKIGEVPVDFYAKYMRRDERYLLTKSIKVWSIENQQCVFVRGVNGKITADFIADFAKQIDLQIPTFIPGKQEHMSTFFLGVMITDEAVDHKVQKEIKRSRKITFLKYGLHGWADRYMVVVSLKDKKVYVNQKGREFVTGFEDALMEEDER